MKLFLMLLLLLYVIVLEPVRSVGSKTETLHMAVYENPTPLSGFIELKTYIVDALKKENIEIEYHPVPNMRSSELVQSGKLDAQLIVAKEIQDYFPELIFTKNPVVITNMKVAYLKTNKKFDYNNLKKFHGAFILNNVAIKKMALKRGLSFTEVKAPPQAFELLERKYVDYVILSEEVIAAFIKADPRRQRIFTTDSHTFYRMPLYMAFNKKLKPLVPKVERALQKALHDQLPKYPMLQTLINKDI